MDTSTLEQAFAELDRLSNEEYGEPLAKVLENDGVDRSVERVGRLGGVLLKEPFATPHDRETPSDRTGALRSWELKGEPEFNQELETGSWQSQALTRIYGVLVERDELNDEEKQSVYALAEWAQNERGFFSYFGRVVKRYMCGDPAVRKKVQEALDAAQGNGGGSSTSCRTADAGDGRWHGRCDARRRTCAGGPGYRRVRRSDDRCGGRRVVPPRPGRVLRLGGPRCQRRRVLPRVSPNHVGAAW
jgi:hypothetical protein